MTKKHEPMKRPFTTDYAGTWRGHCKTRESAIEAGLRNALYQCTTNCTVTDTNVTDPKRQDIAWIHRDHRSKTITIKVRNPLSDVPLVKRVVPIPPKGKR